MPDFQVVVVGCQLRKLTGSAHANNTSVLGTSLGSSNTSSIDTFYEIKFV